MEPSLQVTDQPREACFFDMISGDSALMIPLFQRAYRWDSKELEWLFSDIIEIRDDVAKSVFLGVVVCVARSATPGRPVPWEIVDGQQRLTTLYLALMAAAEVYARKGELASAAGVIGSYLLIRPLPSTPINTKLVPSYADRFQFKKIWDSIIAIPGLISEPTVASNMPKPPPPSGAEKGKMLKQYSNIKRKLQDIFEKDGASGVEEIVNIIVQRLGVVSISLRDPIVAPKIFERLNNRAVLVTTADLVRNEVFARTFDNPSDTRAIFETEWEPFAQRFAEIECGLEKFLFPYGLILKPTLTKADLFSQIRTYWATLAGPREIIEDMDKYSDVFLALELGRISSDLPSEVAALLSRLHRLGKPSSTFAFVMRVGLAVKTGELSVDDATSILRVVEDFLFRRALCGIEPTGLHAVFKNLWNEMLLNKNGLGMTAQSAHNIISSKPTVSWPDDNQFYNSVISVDLYKRKVCKFALREYEAVCVGDSSSDSFEVEHILPQSLNDHWSDVFGHHHSELHNTWANLIPVSKEMNPEAGRSPYEVKRITYLNSMFSTARSVANTYAEWTPETLKQRAEVLAAWALKRWPTSRTKCAI